MFFKPALEQTSDSARACSDETSWGGFGTSRNNYAQPDRKILLLQ